MKLAFTKRQVALAAIAAIGASAMTTATTIATANEKKARAGTYVTGDFHNHTTCSDGSISMQKLVKKSMDKTDTPWGLDWFVQAGHGGSGNRNCTLAEDASLSTPAYPFTGQGPTTTWAASIGNSALKGDGNGTGAAQQMWRWQSVQDFQYPLLEYLARLRDQPLFMGVETVVPGHEHTSMSVVTGQMPATRKSERLPTGAGYQPIGNAVALAQWEYCFDRNDRDTSRMASDASNCAVTGSLNQLDPSWSAVAQKLIPSGADVGTKGHLKAVESVKWMAEKHPLASYYVPAHLERAGPFNPVGNNGFNIEHLRNLNNAGPQIAFGMESQPGHGASSDRGEYAPNRNAFGTARVDTVGGTTYGGTGVYGALVGGVWDALLGEGRNWWFFASSDWHNRGMFGADDRRSTQDFYPGEYQRDFVMVERGKRGDDDDKNPETVAAKPRQLTPQTIVDGLRSGNSFVASGQLIDRLSFVACAIYPPGRGGNGNAAHVNPRALEALVNAQVGVVEALAYGAARKNADVDRENCAGMGEKLIVRPGAEIAVAIAVRDPSGTSYSPYTFPNPSLAQIGVNQPLNAPVLDHIDLVRGLVTGYKAPGAADYAGAWPNTWLANPDINTVPAAAKNTSAAVIKTFNGAANGWKNQGDDYLTMSYRLPAVTQSQYLRLRGSNLPANVPFETDANGNPLRDLETNSGAVNASTVGGTDGKPENFYLKIPCRTAGTTEFNGCPSHLPSVTIGSYTGKAVALDVAAWADLWFYSNPIYIEVRGSTQVAGVK